MGEQTGIEWTNATWNPWMGCHKVSPGCKFCYMFRERKRYGQNPDVVVRSKTKFRDPLKWPKEPKFCFTCSWSDWLIEEADAWREEAYDVIRATPWITYQILTKRIERAAGRVPDPPLANIWLGVSVESPVYLHRIDALRSIPAAVRFLSIEPLLQDVGFLDLSGIDWVIVGGESGPIARPMHPDWVRSIRDQCIGAGVPFFFKQWGEYHPITRTDGIHESPFVPGGQHMVRVGKKAAGAVLDGREWREMPAGVTSARGGACGST
jgi:protein gp37